MRGTIVVAFAMLLLRPMTAGAVDTEDTRFLHDPAISAGRIVFVYAEDLWTAKPDGSDVRRLTSHPGSEFSPSVSPDGATVAFTANYDGNIDVYVIPIDGGEPKRLTYHPGADVVRGFTPDGKVLFTSQRSVFTRRFAEFFTVGTRGGFPTKLPIPSGDLGAVSPDGKFLAYTPLSEAFRQWKHYRGGRTSRIWVLKLDDLSVEMIPQPDGRCNDTEPMWIGDTVYFLSDRAGEFNLFSFDRAGKEVKQLTHHDDYPIESASAGAGKVVYEQAGRLAVFDPESDQAERLKIGVAADLTEIRPRFVSGEKYIRDADISPSGKRAVFEFRGEIITVPAKKGDPRNLTQTNAVHERSPAWSPDGESIAYFSDATGEYTLHIRPQDGKGEGKIYPLSGAGFYERPIWAPDGKKLAFIDNSRTLYLIDLDAGKVQEIASEPIYGPVNTLTYAWSPDSRWLAYTLTNRAQFQTLSVYSTEEGKSHALTDGLAEVSEPVFDASGKYLYFLTSTDAGPVKQWFAQSNTDVQATHALYMAVLAQDTPNPLLKESDEEGEEDEDADEGDAEEKKKEEKDRKDAIDADSAQKDGKPKPEANGQKEDEDKDKDAEGADGEEDEEVSEVVIDFDGIEGRIVPLPASPGMLSNLEAGAEGEILYIRRVGYVPGRSGEAFEGTPSLVRFKLEDREEETLADGVDGFHLSAGDGHLLYHDGETWGIVETGPFEPGKDALDIAAISVRIDPRAEWPQIFQEAWRINRDYFYAPNMHGADWPAIREKYASWLPDVPTRSDLNRLIRMMCSELSVGHSYLFGGDSLYEPKTVPVGLLGADFEVADGHYRFTKIYGGAYWDPELKAPLRAPGVDVKPGEYLLSVDGRDLTADDELFSRFEQKVAKRVELKVGPKADGTDARTVIVEPIDDESALRNRDWVEGNLHKVHERTNGRVAYVYVPNTADLGHAYFKRYFFPQVDREAIIIDERFNGGGQVADYYIDLLRRPLISYWATRHGEPLRTPGGAIDGPKVMIIDETAGSGGDLLPWMFRKFELGTLVGRRTWGGLVGILGFPVLMDGGMVTAPDIAIFTEDGWVVENEGVPPDVEVEQMPADVAEGKDPQLDRAIEIVLKKLDEQPPSKLPRPPFPIRVRAAEAAVAR